MAMLQDPVFFEIVPAFAHLKPSVDWAVHAAKTGQPVGKCEKCGDIWQHFRPIVSAFMLKLVDMLRTKEAGLQSIRTYLSQKKRYDVGKVVLYYNGESADSMQKLTF